MANEYADTHRAINAKNSVSNALNEFIKRREPTLSPSTIRGYKNIQRYLNDKHLSFMGKPITGIEKSDLQNLVNQMVAEDASPKTISNRMGLIASVLKENDVFVPSISLPRREKADLKIPDTKDVERIIQIVTGTEMEIPVLLACFGPMRRSEIIALEMDDIEGNTIHVKRAVVMDADGKNVTKTTKTYDSNRYIPMSENIINKIRKQGYVTKIDNPQILSQRFMHIAKQAGCKGTRFHDLRHWCASYLHAQGVPDQYIMARAGWKTDRVMKSVYRHELVSETNKWTQEINGFFTDIMSHK